MESKQPEWKTVALGLFPEHFVHLAEADSRFMLWIELWRLFAKAYDEPKNVSMIMRVYQFADWCERQPRGSTAEDDLLTCVAVCFYEEIPQVIAAWEDMPNWLTRSEYEDLETVFRYHFSDREFDALRNGLEGRVFRQSNLTPI